MLLLALSPLDEIVAIFDSERTDGATFHDDTLHTYLSGDSATLDFTIPRFINGKHIPETDLIDDATRWQCTVDGTTYKFYTDSMTDDLTSLAYSCNNLSLEYLLETADAFSEVADLNIDQYIKKIVQDTGGKYVIGNNDIGIDKTKRLTFDSDGTKSERLAQVADAFNAYFKYSTTKDNKLKIDIYDKAKPRLRTDYVFDEEDFDLGNFSIEKDKSELYSSFFIRGKTIVKSGDDEKEETITIAHQDFKEYDDDGVLRLYTEGNYIRAPYTLQKYTKGVGGINDYVEFRDVIDVKDEQELWDYAIGKARELSKPKINLTCTMRLTDRTRHLRVGDTITVDQSHHGALKSIFRFVITEISFSPSSGTSLDITASNTVEVRNRTVKEYSTFNRYSGILDGLKGSVFYNNIDRKDSHIVYTKLPDGRIMGDDGYTQEQAEQVDYRSSKILLEVDRKIKRFEVDLPYSLKGHAVKSGKQVSISASGYNGDFYIGRNSHVKANESLPKELAPSDVIYWSIRLGEGIMILELNPNGSIYTSTSKKGITGDMQGTINYTAKE